MSQQSKPTPGTPKPPLEDPLHEKEIFATEIAQMGMLHGNLVITLACVRSGDPIGNQPPKMHRVVVGRIVAGQRLHQGRAHHRKLQQVLGRAVHIGPQVQHRGGPAGFLKVLDERTIGFADYRGNKQYISIGNTRGNDRVALLLIDHARRRRLKLLGRAEQVDLRQDPALARQLIDTGYTAKVERGWRIRVEAFDWNCPQHITPRFSTDEIVELVAPMRLALDRLQAENDALKARLAGARPQEIAP